MKTTIKTNNLTQVIAAAYDASKFPIGFSALTLGYTSNENEDFEVDVWVYNDEEDKENTPNQNYWCFQHAQVEHDDETTYVTDIKEEYPLQNDELQDMNEEQIIEHIKSLI